MSPSASASLNQHRSRRLALLHCASELLGTPIIVSRSFILAWPSSSGGVAQPAVGVGGDRPPARPARTRVPSRAGICCSSEGLRIETGHCGAARAGGRGVTGAGRRRTERPAVAAVGRWPCWAREAAPPRGRGSPSLSIAARGGHLVSARQAHGHAPLGDVLLGSHRVQRYHECCDIVSCNAERRRTSEPLMEFLRRAVHAHWVRVLIAEDELRLAGRDRSRPAAPGDGRDVAPDGEQALVQGAAWSVYDVLVLRRRSAGRARLTTVCRACGVSGPRPGSSMLTAAGDARGRDRRSVARRRTTTCPSPSASPSSWPDPSPRPRSSPSRPPDFCATPSSSSTPHGGG